MRGGACNIVPRGYSGPWHYEGEQKCKGDPPRNNNNTRNNMSSYQVKAYSPYGGKKSSKTRRGGGKRRSTRRRVGGTASSSASNASAVGTGTFANGRSGPIGANGRLPTGPGAFDKW